MAGKNDMIEILDLNNFISSENKKLYRAIAALELETSNRIEKEVLEQYGFSQNTKVTDGVKDYEVNFILYDESTVYMHLLHEERVMYYYPNAPIEYETHTLRVNLADFNDFEVVE